MKQVLLVVCILGLYVFKTNAQCSFTVSAGTDTTICGNQSANLHGSVNPTVGAYTYQWTPSATLTGSTTLSPIASPNDTTTYTLSVTSGGCTATASVTVNVSGAAVVVRATVTPAAPICPGDTAHLSASIVPTTCGLAPACPSITLSPVIGSGSTLQPGGIHGAPTILGNYNESVRNQMLYTAAELNAALGGACTLDQLSVYIVFNSNAYLQGFTVSLACTNLDSLSTFNNNLVQVLYNPLFQPSNNNAGRNDLPFNTGYNWDGVSNLIVDICWYDPGLHGNGNNKALCTTTATTSYLYNQTDTGSICGTNVAPVLSTLRPNISLGFCNPNINSYHIAWTPSTGVNAVDSPGVASPIARPTTSQNYTIGVGTGACIGYSTVSVTLDTSRVSAGPDISSCPGSAVNLTATVIGTVIPGPATFTWTTLAGTVVGTTQNVTVHPTVNTTYIVAMSGGACTHYDTINVTLGSLNVVATPTNIKCFGQNNGKVVVVASNGTTPYTYTWGGTNPGNIDSAVNLTSGIYTVTVNDVNTCSGTATATVTAPTSAPAESFSLGAVSCNGGSDGTITVNPSGGTPGYTYAWSNSLPPVAHQTGLSAGTYTVTLTDANGCTVSNNVPLGQPSAITFGAATIQNEKCAGGSTGKITIAPTGGTPGYTYAWSNSATTQTISGITAGAYVVTVTDTKFCTATATYTITQPAGVTFGPPIIDSTKCFGSSDGSAAITPTGGTLPYTYLWTPSGQTTDTATGLSAQTYTVVVTDDSLCPATTTVVVPQPAQMHISAVTTNITCNGANNGTITITATTNAYAPVTYSWSNLSTATALTGLSAGNYSVTVTDAHSCTASAAYVITEPAVLDVTISSQTNVLCFNGATGSITSAGTGGVGPYTYTWSNSASTAAVNGLTAGPYSVTVTDVNHCTVDTNLIITQPLSGPVFGTPVITNLLCSGSSTGSILVSVSGGTPGYTYSWSQNHQLNDSLASNLAAGSYTVTATDAGGCSVSSTNTITQPTPVSVGAPVVINDSCHGGNNGSITVNPSGGAGTPYTYTWNGAAGTNPETGLVANTYIVVVSDANGCTASASIPVGQPAPIMDSISIQNVRCFGGSDGSLMVYPYGGNAPFTFAWSNGSTTQLDSLLDVQNSPYTVTITDNTGCTATDVASITQPTLLTFTHSETQVKCPGQQNGTITAIGSGGTPPYNFSVTKDGANFINAPSGVAEGLDSGLYYIYLSDNNGCIHIDTAFIKSPVADSFAVTVDSTTCYGAAYTDGSIMVTPLVANNMPFTYTIDGGSVQDTSYFGNLGAGLHKIIATNQFGCPTEIDTTVSQPGQAFATVLPADTTIQLGQSIKLQSTFGPYSYSSIVAYNWVPFEGLSCVDCPNPIATPYSHITQYTLTITYNDNCITTDSMNIIVQNNLQYFIPNSFTPNGDGNNDVFEVYGEGIKTVKLRVFNRWGEKVFESNSQFNGWDGTYKGIIQNPGVYTYEAQITFLDDTQTERAGSITLIR